MVIDIRLQNVKVHACKLMAEAELHKIAYSIEEVCEMAGLSRMTVHKEIKEGRLSSSRIGSRHLISMEDIEAWLENAKKQETTTPK